ncbi:MAG TPA: hypothetical protein VJJ22_04965 [Candidatus Paceibacterota bacterium]
MIIFIQQVLLALGSAICAWAFVFALLGHEYCRENKEGDAFAAENITGRLFDFFLVIYPVLLLTYLFTPINLAEIKLVAVGFVGFILGFIMLKLNMRDFFKMIGVYFALEALVLFTTLQAIGLVMITTLSTALVASYLFFVAESDESVRSLLYAHLKDFRIVLWVGLFIFSPLYIGSFFKNMLLVIIIIGSIIISVPFSRKLSSLSLGKRGVTPLTGKWSALFNLTGSIYITAWFLMFYLQMVQGNISGTLFVILFICLSLGTFLGYRLLEGRAVDLG